MKKTPFARVKEQFESKEKLVAAVQALATEELWLDRLNDVKGLARVSNAKLLRLHDLLTTAKKEFGSREKLVGAILELEKRVKDEGFKARLANYSLPRLFDQHRAASRRAAEPKAAPKKPAAKKAKSREARPS
jgi:hypothetical protein